MEKFMIKIILLNFNIKWKECKKKQAQEQNTEKAGYKNRIKLKYKKQASKYYSASLKLPK